MMTKTAPIEATNIIYHGTQKVMTVSPGTSGWMREGGYIRWVGKKHYRFTKKGVVNLSLPLQWPPPKPAA